MISQEKAHDFVKRGARIRVHSGAIGGEKLVMAEGKVISYSPAPTLTIEHDDGTRSSWSVDLPITEVEWEKAVPYRIYSQWVRTGNRSHKSVWMALQEAYAAGQEQANGEPL